MSFSGEVKAELAKQIATARHCQIAELAAILLFTNAIIKNKEQYVIDIQEESSFCIQKGYLLLQKTCQIEQMTEDASLMKHVYLEQPDRIDAILQTIKYKEGQRNVTPLLIKSVCCKRAFLRGAFLSIGSMSNPQKGYHLEFVCDSVEQADQIREVLRDFELEAKIVQRKKYQVLYMKESEGIVELLNIMGAHISLMNLENLRILKDMRNSINRRVNCEAANINKTVNAASKQIEDIQYLKEHYGFENLSDQLRDVAEARLAYTDATLKELGEFLVPPVGKSGVNHRLRKLGELADKMRQ